MQNRFYTNIVYPLNMIAFECRDYLDNRELEIAHLIFPCKAEFTWIACSNSDLISYQCDARCIWFRTVKMVPHQQENNLAGLMILFPYGSMWCKYFNTVRAYLTNRQLVGWCECASLSPPTRVRLRVGPEFISALRSDWLLFGCTSLNTNPTGC
jgi:hypothetical protein